MIRDHYVSQFYLEGFTDPSSPKQLLSVYLKALRAWKRLTPKNVGVETGYYTISTEDGQKHRGIEKALSEIESRAATIIRERIKSRTLLSDEERVHFGIFVATMLERVPSTIDNLGDAYRKTADLVRRWGTEVPESADDPQTGVLAQTMLKIAFDTTAPILLGMSWRFVFLESYLATSDRPVCMIDPTNPGPMPSGLLSEGMQVWFPLTRDILFMATHFDASPLEYVSQPAEWIAGQANKLTLRSARRFVAAPDESFEGATELQVS